MTSTQTQLRGGTNAQVGAMTPAAREVVVNTTKNRLHVGDSARQGGYEVPNFSDVQCQSMTAVDAGGTADAITVAISPQPLAWTAYLSGSFKAAYANATTAPTLAISGLSGTKTIKKKGASGKAALAAGDIQAGVIYRWVYDGTDVQLEAVDIAPPSGLVKLKTETFSGASQVDFTSLIAAGYSEFRWVIENLTVSVDGANLTLLTSSDNGSSFATAAASYSYLLEEGNLQGTFSSKSYIRSASATFMLLADSIGNAAAEGLSGSITARGLLGTTRKKIFRIETEWQDNSTVDQGVSGHGARLSTSAINAVRFKPSTGNISGTIHMYGLKS